MNSLAFHAASSAQRPLVVIEEASELGLLKKYMKPCSDRALARDFMIMNQPRFRVDYVINPWMEGNKDKVDRSLAAEQWVAYSNLMRKCAPGTVYVKRCDDVRYPDIIFAANAGVTFVNRDGEKCFIKATMSKEERAGEVPIYTRELVRLGYKKIIGTKYPCEGCGDVLRIPNTEVYIATYGFRTTREAIIELAMHLQAPVIALRLTDERFYHGDTAHRPVSHERIVYYPGAFEQKGVEILERLFAQKRVLNEQEACAFGANMLVFPKDIILARGAPQLVEDLQKWDFDVHEPELSELKKAGGAAACMALALESW